MVAFPELGAGISSRSSRFTPRSSGVESPLLLGFRSYVLQTNRFAGVVLELHGVLLLVVGNLGRDRQLAFPLALRLQANLDQREWIVHRPRLISRFPEPHSAIGQDDDLFATVFAWVLACIVQVVAERVGQAHVANAFGFL